MQLVRGGGGHLQDVVAGVGGQLGVEHRGAHPERLQEQPQPQPGVDAVHEQQHPLVQQPQPQQRQHRQQPVTAAGQWAAEVMRVAGSHSPGGGQLTALRQRPQPRQCHTVYRMALQVWPNDTWPLLGCHLGAQI